MREREDGGGWATQHLDTEAWVPHEGRDGGGELGARDAPGPVTAALLAPSQVLTWKARGR